MPTIYKHDLAYDLSPEQPVEGSRAFDLGMEQLERTHRVIDTETPIYPSDTIGEPDWQGGYDVSVVGEIALPLRENGQAIGLRHAAILKGTKDGASKYMIQGLYTNDQGLTRTVPTPAVEIPTGATLVIGRNGDDPTLRENDEKLVSAEMIWGPGAEYGLNVSGEQLRIRAQKRLLHLYDEAAHGTYIKANYIGESTNTSKGAEIGLLKARNLGKLSLDGKFAGGEVINSYTTLGGKDENGRPKRSVDLRAWAAGDEISVVDPSEDPKTYAKFYGTFKDFMKQAAAEKKKHGERLIEDDVLESIYKTGQYWVTYDTGQGTVKELLERTRKETGTDMVNIAKNIKSYKAICRQMALMMAWLGGEAAEEGYLDRTMTAHDSRRAVVTGGRDDNAHQYTRYTKRDGTVMVLDLAGEYLGSLEDSLDRHGWDYFMPGEKASYLRSKILRAK